MGQGTLVRNIGQEHFELTNYLPISWLILAQKCTLRGSLNTYQIKGFQMKGKLYIKTHGCQMNEYDSDKMADVLAASHGLELTDSELYADVILVNTCSIREKAQEKVFSQLGRWKKFKADGRKVVIGVGGCVASQEGGAIIKRAPYC